jgi:cation:H+ antiporter
MEWVLLGIPLGIIMLYFGSDWLVDGAKKLALKLGIAPFVVGLTVIAFGSSAPEIITSIVSTKTPGIILGNVIGSNIVNVGVAIGVAAMICPLAAVYRTMKIELLTMIGTAFLLLALAFTGTIGLPFGILLLAILVSFVYIVYRTKINDKEGQQAYAAEAEGADESTSYPILIAMIAVGLVLLYYGATFFVDGATELAHMIGISDFMVGLIIVAIGTSLPEICICAMAAKRGESDLAVSNIVGSNVFNATVVLGTGACLVDIPVASNVLMIHLPVMILLSLMMFAFVYRRNQIGRTAGMSFLCVYIAYIAVLACMPSLA